MVRVSAVVPAYNEERSIGGTLQSLLDQSLVPEEIIVADGGSTDSTVDVVDCYTRAGAPVRLVENPARRVGAGRNAGILAARNEIAVCIDAGNTAHPGWIEELAPKDTEVVFGRVVPVPTSRFETAVAGVLYDYLLCPPRNQNERAHDASVGKDLLSSSSIAIPRRIWRSVGGYPEWLDTAEDLLFVKRLERVGAPITKRHGAVVYHHMPSTPAALVRQHLRYGIGAGRAGLTRRRVWWLAARYSGAAGLIGTAVAAGSWPLLMVAVLLASAGGAVYSWRQGLRPLRRSRLRVSLGLVLRVPLILVARDLGMVPGHCLGTLNRWLHSAERRRTAGYLSGSKSKAHGADADRTH